MTSLTINLDPMQQDPLVNFINQQLESALQQGASDIHFEPYQQQYRVRARYDGLLRQQAIVPDSLAKRLISRLNVMAKLDITETRLTQDGRIQVNKDQQTHSLRISTCNTSSGEKAVLRLFNQQLLTLSELGLDSHQADLFQQRIKQPQGLTLVCGPTGSGKTMTLYAALQALNHDNKNIVSIEDPIEVFIDGINQTAVHSEIQLTFSAALRSFLRQDPDIIMLGEIRDEETAITAVKAAQTGHLVLATLHSNDCLSALNRLTNLGVNRSDLLEACNLIISQRLLRKLCSHCKQTQGIPVKLAAENQSLKDTSYYKAQGCEHCHQGYRGRLAVFELLPFNVQTRQQALSTNDPLQHHTLFKTLKLPTLKQSAIKAVQSGKTCWQELQRAIYDEYD